MRLTLVQTGAFDAEWRRLRLTDDDLRALENALMSNPERGDVMKGTGGLRKMRFAPPTWHTGKSGALRVCYAHVPAEQTVWLVTLFGKGEKANLNDEEKNAVRKLLQRIVGR